MESLAKAMPGSGSSLPPGGAPPVGMRIMTKERRGDVELEKDVPSYSGRPGSFMWKLISTWAAKGIRRPDMGLAQIPQTGLDGDQIKEPL